MTYITVQYHYVQAPKVLEQGSKVIKTITEDTVGTQVHCVRCVHHDLQAQAGLHE